jgi:hypothetical protein
VGRLLGKEAQRLLEVVERFADGRSSPDKLIRARGEVRYAEKRARGKLTDAQTTASRAARLAANDNAVEAAIQALQDCERALRYEAYGWNWPRSLNHRSEFTWIARDVFGNPFRPVAIDPTWRTLDVRTMARAVSDASSQLSGEMDLQSLAILADALEDASCTNQDILSHLRGSGPHVRFCWAVDLFLGKE